ncbi:pyrroline-5-carboxylate reductase [Ancylobacter aquaticus]|uniref:Pyrroline-5-carboxylate reductase n=1 Tax=Ancylobacter aquaticus TaxID=100 RepID=A0A4R1I4F1_ANCAQ|nr:pyrroline-5-carboxylate reductase dimerization domain-containing protein [Ancylobacter aquaticus]TCK30167.1 pyrroline-5-carboxylate reductase [Ancylobacter aquaticus]
MDKIHGTLGLVGCAQLGAAIGGALLRAGTVEPTRMWIANRSGPVAALAGFSGLNWTRDVQTLADRCDTLLLALPPATGRPLRFEGAGRLVVSVMAGVSVEQLALISGGARVVRAMSSPAAAIGMAYSPFFAGAGVTEADRALVRTLFSACGITDEVPAEGQIDVFTAITGPVPGFVAAFAASVQDYAQAQGVDAEVARRAVGQLFHAAGALLAQSDRPAADFVQEMVDYAGTTAAGLEALRAAGLADVIAQGLEAARQRCLTIGRPLG